MLNQTDCMTGSLENKGVLVVDDEADTRNLLTSVLKHYGVQVKTAASVAEALSVLWRIDLR
jgi:CheY-like chemotaxis protein